MIDGAVGGEMLHDVGASTKGPDGEAAANHLAHRNEVGGEALELLHATLCEAEASHDLVEDEEGTVLPGEIAHQLEEPGAREDEAGIRRVGLGDQSRDLVSVLGEGFGEDLGMIIGDGDGLGSEGLGDAGRVWFAKGERAGASCHQE